MAGVVANPAVMTKAPIYGYELKAYQGFGSRMFWFRWDTTEVWHFNFSQQTWAVVNGVNPPSKFLYFASIVHLPQDQGCFILGGSDFEDNYSKRVLHFNQYNNFSEKSPLIFKRAFFASVYSEFDHSIYSIGGNDSQDDLKEVERYSIAEDCWRQVSPMNVKRNGCAACVFPESKTIFAFGGNNREIGSLDTIEKYSVVYDKWEMIRVRLSMPLHDLQVQYLTRGRVMVLGGNHDDGPSLHVEVLELQTQSAGLTLQRGGKTYHPPIVDE